MSDQSPPPPSDYGLMPPPSPRYVQQWRPSFVGVCIWVGLGLILLAISELLQLLAYRNGSLVVLKAGELGHAVAAVGYGLIGIASFFTSGKVH